MAAVTAIVDSKRVVSQDLQAATMRLMVLALTYPIANAVLQGSVRVAVLGALVLTQEITYPYV